MKKLQILFFLFILGLGLAAIFSHPNIAHAQQPNPATTPVSQTLSDSLKPGVPGSYWPWIETPWKLMLGLANAVVVIVLLFLAIVNIAHVNYDTYAIKKSLPLLIIGVIMANFSLLICRMIIDTANVLMVTFTHNDITGTIFNPLMDGLGIGQIGTAGAGIGAGTILVGWLLGGPGVVIGVGLLILTLLLLMLPVFAAIILVFLLYIRVAVLIFLAIVAPLAFILYAFPPAQSIFKQWWSNFIKWTFMKPIMFLVLWIAARIGEGNATDFNLTIWIIVLALTYFAFIVPFKLGGAVMGAWGNLGKMLSGTGKGGYLRKPAEEWAGRKKELAKGKAGGWFYGKTGVGRWMERGRRAEELELATQKGEKEGRGQAREREIRARLGTQQENREINIEMEKQKLEQQKRDNMFRIYNEQRGRELATFEADIANSELRLEKRKEDSRVTIADERLRANNEIPDDLRDALGNLDRAQEARAMVDPNDAQAVQNADNEVAQAQQNIQPVRQQLLAQINPVTNQNYTENELNNFQNNSLNRLQRTRYFAIVNTRSYEDAKDDSESNAPSAIADDIIVNPATHPDGRSSIGPFQWTQQDAINFFTNQRTSSASATEGLSTKMASLRINLQNTRTMGAAMQGYAGILNQANPQMLQTAFQQATARMDPTTLQQLQAAFQQQGTTFDAAGLAQASLDTYGNMRHRGFVNSILNELSTAETNTAVYGTNANSGLGRNVAAYTERL